MQNLAESEVRAALALDWQVAFMKNRECTFHREIADADQPFRFENANNFAEVCVARGKQFLAFARRQFVRCSVAAAVFDKRERAIIHDDVLAEKFVSGTETFREQSPQTFAADFAAMTIEAEHRPLRMLALRFIDLRFNAKPIAHCRDLAEGNSSLRHAERAGIHPEKDHALRAIPVTPHINFVRAPRVIERVVNVRDRRSELQFINRVAQALRSND